MGLHDGDIDLVVETAPYYRLSESKAREIVGEVRTVLGTWRTVADAARVSEAEIEVLSAAIDT